MRPGPPIARPSSGSSARTACHASASRRSTKTERLPFGGTDRALSMLYATAQKLPVDTFVVLTDSETWAGAIHPVQALRAYREQSGLAARLLVVGLVANAFSIADPGRLIGAV